MAATALGSRTGSSPIGFASGARSSRRKQRCWIFHISGITHNVSEDKLLISVREKYTTVKRLVVTSTLNNNAQSTGNDILVEVQFTGPQPSEGPGALLCDLLCGSGVEARPVELPRGRKKRTRSGATSSEASDSDVEDVALRKMSSHRSTGSLQDVGEEDVEDVGRSEQRVAVKPVLVGQGQGGSPMYVGTREEPGATRRSSWRNSVGAVVPSANLKPLTRTGLFKQSPPSSTPPPCSASGSVIVPEDTRGALSAAPALTRAVVSPKGITTQSPPPQQHQPEAQQEFKAGDGGAGGGEHWNEAVCLSPIDLASSTGSQDPVKTEMEPLIMSMSTNSNGTWNSNDSQVAILGPVPPPQSMRLSGWSFDSPPNATGAGGDFGGGNAVMDMSDMENLFRSAGEESVHTSSRGSSVAALGGSNADAGAGEGPRLRPKTEAKAQAQAQPEKWITSDALAMEKVIIEPSRTECDFEGRPLSGNTVGPPSSSSSAQCYLVFTGLELTEHELRNLRVTANFGVDAVHRVGKVTLPILAGNNGRAYAPVSYPSMQEIWPELFNTTNIRVVEVDVVVEIRTSTAEYQFVGPELKVIYLRSPPDGLDGESNSTGRRSGASRSSLSSTDEAPQVSYTCVDYSCGDWFAEVCSSVFRPNATTAHQPLNDESQGLMNVEP